ncbi:MAG: YjdF family protein [Coriobacteriales bacterium]|nr:YjdF family protein [Coriobacteriales bacterium]
MRKIRVSSTLTIYHDGRFWVGTFERIEDGRLSVCRIVFGSEPSNEEIQELICRRWSGLHFTLPVEHEAVPELVSNPKRRHREISKELRNRGPSTKAQLALSEEREAAALQRKAAARECREADERERFELRREKHKLKHRGK